MTFEELNLNSPLLNALKDLEYQNPTPIQAQSFPIIMSGKDMVGIAQTGTGKTMAYLLPLLRQHKFSDQKHPRILIVVPTRELVLQVVEEVEKLTKYMTIRCLGVYGGTNINTQKQKVYDGADLMVATPGRLADLAMSGVLRLKSVQKVVIDEVDEMLNLGFRGQIISLLEMLPIKRQNLLFSATLSPEVDQLITDFFSQPEKLEIHPHGTPIERIIQRGYHVPNFNSKISLLELLLNDKSEMNRVLVFADSKKLADLLKTKMETAFPGEVGVMHSNKAQNQRLNTLKKFEEGTFRVLIATDIIARGLDISDVSHVINFDMPEKPGDYIHRVGRTGRADKDGIAISLIADAEMDQLTEIENMMKLSVPILPLPEKLVLSKVLTEDEKNNLFSRDYLEKVTIKSPNGAFHEKKEKNKKINLGGPRKRNPKYEKPKRKRYK